MLTGVWRNGLLVWLQDFLIVDQYSDTEPELGKTNGFLSPLTNVRYTKEGDGLVRGTGEQKLEIMKHLPASKYRDLDIAGYETMHSTLAYHALLLANEIAPINSIDTVEVDTPIVVAHYGESKDWLVIFTWQFALSWYVDPLVPVPDEYNTNRIEFNLFNNRQEDDFTDGRDPYLSVLDFTTNLNIVDDPVVLTSKGIPITL